jgi:(R,R)-butanediol dehydrogenase/meso-butanediol dehydrogenase/diacetyl reductase
MLSLVGYTAELSSVSYGDWVARELRLVASLAYTHQDFLGAMAMLASGAVQIGPVVTGTVGLTELAGVLGDLRSGSTVHAKVLVDPTR